MVRRQPVTKKLSLNPLPEPFASWFDSRGWSPRPHQLGMLEKARQGRHALLIAPTGGGKTLAGFLPSLIDIAERPPANTPRGVHTLYISPLKALAVDVERNLMIPIKQMGLKVTAESRTGDTGVSRRQRQRIKPPDILLTTPEQLALFCAWEGARLFFEDLRCIILDEIHAVWPSKRGDLLALDLARVATFAPRARRVGLSATVEDPGIIRRWMSPTDGEDVDIVRGYRRGAARGRRAAERRAGALGRPHRPSRHAGGLRTDTASEDGPRLRQHALSGGVRLSRNSGG